MIGVTGANGWVGREVVNWLTAHGRVVRRLVRQPKAPGDVTLDLSATEIAPESVAGCETIVHCAAHVHLPIETSAEAERFERINVHGTARLLAAAQSARVRRIVFISTAAVYDWSRGEAVTEESPLAPSTAYATSKCYAESLVQSSALSWCIVRLATVFGRGDVANFQKLARALRRRRFVLPGAGTARKTVLPISMAGELIGRLAVSDVPERLIVNVGSPVPPSLAEICEAFTRVAGFPPAWRVPVPLLRAVAAVGDITAMAGVPFPLHSVTLRKLTTSTVLDVARMRSLFPDIVWTPFADALRPDVDYYCA